MAHRRSAIDELNGVQTGQFADLERKIEIMNETMKEKTAQYEEAQKNAAVASKLIEELSNQVAALKQAKIDEG